MKSKVRQIKERWRAGDKEGALSIASKFHDRSPETKTFKRAASAQLNPDFYRQLGKSPDRIISDAFDVLARKFSLDT